MYKYSVIIPHKNCPDLLSRCINSIPNRDDIEIIVIDDNSSDISSVKLVESEGKHDNILFIYTTENKGAGYARNVGLEHACGEWLIFADSDDYFEKNAFDIFDNYAGTSFDIIYFPHESVYSDTLEPCYRFSDRNNRISIFLSNKNKREELSLRYCDVVPWSKMIRRAVVSENNLKFDEVPASNDVTFITNSAYHAGSITADKRAVYIATYRQGSITRTPNKDNLFSSYIVSLKRDKFMEQIGCSFLKGRVILRVIKAYKLFGWGEARRYIKAAREYNISMFSGLRVSHKEMMNYIKRYLNKEKDQG